MYGIEMSASRARSRRTKHLSRSLGFDQPAARQPVARLALAAFSLPQGNATRNSAWELGNWGGAKMGL